MMRNIIIAMVLLVALMAFGCSGNSADPVAPDTRSEQTQENQRVHLGTWGIDVDMVNQTAELVPIRNVNAHWDVTGFVLPPFCPYCLSITVNSIDPTSQILDADMTVFNGYQKTPYDLRCIVYTNGDHLLTNADDWTPLWDLPGGMDINPFKAFGKTTATRAFAPGVSFTENFKIHYPIPTMWGSLTFRLEASWPTNCTEPYMIDNFTYDPFPQDGYTIANVDVHDWQSDVNSVILLIPDIDPNPIDFVPVAAPTWKAEIHNVNNVPPGNYQGRVQAKSTGSGGLILADLVTVTIIP